MGSPEGFIILCPTLRGKLNVWVVLDIIDVLLKNI